MRFAARRGVPAAALRAGLAFALLNALLSFENRWPGFGVRLSPRLSFELCVALAALALWVGRRGVPGRRALAALGASVVALAAVRYADVTAPAVLGRPVHVYWDGRHALELLRLATQDWSAWRVAAALAAAGLGALALGAAARASIGALAHALQAPRARAGVLLASVALAACFAAYVPGVRDTRWFFSLPLTPTIVDQGLLLVRLAGPGDGDAVLGAGPDFDSGLGGLARTPAVSRAVGQTDATPVAVRLSAAAPARADVVLLFAESYGAVAFDRPALAAALAPARDALAAAASSGGRGVVSARVTSPTFGGASWLAHAALLAGIDTHDPGHHALLLAGERPTLVRHFARHGWRTVGWMPGLKRPWPEGAFYGFDRLADDAGIGYAGPDLGYWRIPDQAAMALLHAQELARRPDDPVAGRAPRFVVFPTTSTHAPFEPLAPYVDDWTRLFGPDSGVAASATAGAQPDPATRYADALRYQYRWLAGYLHRLAPPGLVLVIVGDHQPPTWSGVGKRGDGWDVPVHVVADDPALLGRLEREGFVPGVVPPATALGPMHALTGVLLRAFDAPAAAASAAPTAVPLSPGAATAPGVDRAPTSRAGIRARPATRARRPTGGPRALPEAGRASRPPSPPAAAGSSAARRA